MNITEETIKENKKKISDLEVLYRLTGTTHIYKDLASIFGVSRNQILYYEKKGKLKDKLELIFDCAKNHKGSEIQFNELQSLLDQSNRRMKRGRGSVELLKNDIIDIQKKSVSAFEAARKLGVSYNTYKKYAKMYGIFDDLKNPNGVGVKRVQKNKPKNQTDIEWQNRQKRKELRDRHLYKYHNKSGEIEYGCALYIITIPKGEHRINYINKWGTLPIKIGISKDVVNRYNDLVLKQEYIPSKDLNWVEWNEYAEIINIIPFYTIDECVRVESRIHTYIRDYRINGIFTKGNNEAWELFNAPFELINEAIETYVTGWRTSKWNADEMNNEYEDNGPKMCNPIEYKIVKSNWGIYER